MVEIAFAGPMGAGKTTVADLLVAKAQYTRLSFAEPLRYLTTTLIARKIDKKNDRSTLQRVGGAARSTDWRGIDTPLEAARQERVQQLARHIFPEAGQPQIDALYEALYGEGYSYGWGDEGYWIRRWKRDYLRAAKPVTVDDCRFPIEGTCLQRMGFFIVKLDVPLEERKRRIIARDGAWDDAWSKDATEALVDGIPVDLVVDGTGTPEAIAEKVLQEATAWKAARRKREPVATGA
jgi:dephospho-CoA kinase